MSKWLLLSITAMAFCLSTEKGLSQNTVSDQQQAEQLRDALYQARSLHQKGSVLQLKGNPYESVRHLERALEIADSLDEKHLKARIHHNLSISQRLTDNYPAASENLYRSLLLSEQEGDYPLMAAVLNDIGEMYYELDNAGEGIYYLEEARDLSSELGLPGILAKTRINLGIAHRENGNFDIAESYLKEARAMEEANDAGNLASIDYNLGTLNLNRGETEVARTFFINSLNISREAGNSEGIYYNSLGMGDLSKQLGRRAEARNWYQAVLEQAHLINSSHLIEQALEKIYNELRESGEMAQAIEVLESIRHHIDSTRTMEYERSRAEYETLFESRKQAQENQVLTAQRAEQEARIQLQQGLGIGALAILAILLAVTFILYGNNRTREKLNRKLQEKNQDISIKNRELDHLNNLKNKMFAVISHDLRGPLSSFKGLLYLIREKNLSGAALDKLARNLEKSVLDNTAAMENLLAWAKSQMSGLTLNFADIALTEVVEEVRSQTDFQAQEKKVPLLVDISPGIHVYGDYDAVNLIVRNLVSNSVKFCETGDTITVKASQKTDFTTIHIVDTGAGIADEDQEKILSGDHFTRKGTKSEKGSGLGLSLCREFVEKHGGEIWFESTCGEGSTFSFTLPNAARESQLCREIDIPAEQSV